MSGPPASIDLTVKDFDAALDLLRGAGLQLDVIYPADQPHTAILSHDGRSIRLTSAPDAPEPGGPGDFRPEFVLTRAAADGGRGRAGMLYRDLIPSRLGGRYIASHITIADGGPVADWVHFHRVAFQMIFVRRGWVRVVYEDQGEPFIMQPGDLVLQPPGIRHRVLESSARAEVIEVGCPASHETFADHEMILPTAHVDSNREFGGQRFLRHVAAEAPWTPYGGGESQETGMAEATNGFAKVRTVRRGAAPTIDFSPHDGELVFGFVLEGSGHLGHGASEDIGPADAFVIPPGEAWSLREMSDDFRMLQVTTGKRT